MIIENWSNILIELMSSDIRFDFGYKVVKHNAAGSKGSIPWTMPTLCFNWLYQIFSSILKK